MIRKILGASTAMAMAMFGVSLTASASEATSEGFPPAQNLNYFHVPGADQAIDGMAAPLGVYAYLFIAGSAFTPRTSSQTVSYPGGGCTYSDAALTTSLELPSNAEIQGVRLYYYNTTPASTVHVFLTTYPGDGSLSDQLSSPSTLSTGYASEYFPFATPLVVDNFNQAYVLTASMNPSTRLCGMRVYYSQ